MKYDYQGSQTHLIPVVRGADDLEGVSLLHPDLLGSHFRHMEGGTDSPRQQQRV